ncbi:MAG TPA: cytochrome c [Burkholderiaceae bacterium]|nr:cytochrome c [Burkholderiaceae bacterium]
MRSFGWLALGVIVLAGSAALAWWQVTLPPATRVDPKDPLVVARGQQVYDAQCASCHGKDLEGQPDWHSRLPNGRLPAPPHDATGHTWHHPSEMLFSIVKDGIVKNAPPGYESDMPAYAGVLPDNDIRAVLSYIKSRWPEDIRRRHDALDQAVRNQR